MMDDQKVMIACSVRICSMTDGKKSIQNCKGTLSKRADEYQISYVMQSSAVRITLKNNQMRMLREGDCYLDLLFDQTKEQTQGVIGLSRDTAGNIEILTNTLQTEYEGEGLNIKIKIKLNYVLRYVGQDQPVELQLIADAR